MIAQALPRPNKGTSVTPSIVLAMFTAATDSVPILGVDCRVNVRANRPEQFVEDDRNRCCREHAQ